MTQKKYAKFSQELDGDTLEVVMAPQIDWSHESIDIFKATVSNADSLTFRTKYVEDGCCFGQLFAFTKEQPTNVSEILIESKESIEVFDYLYGTCLCTSLSAFL